MKRSMWAALGFCLLAALSASAGQSLYSVGFSDGGELIWLAEQGVTVRHVGSWEAVVEADAEIASVLARAGIEYEILGGVGDWEELYLCYPRTAGQVMGRFGDIIWVESGGAVLVGTTPGRVDALRAACFLVRPLPASIDVVSWFDNTPPPLVRTWTPSRERRVRGVVEDVLDAVSADSLMEHVDKLTRYPDESLRTRYVRREECLTEAKPYIMEKLAEYLPASAAIDTQRFYILGYTCEEGVGGPVIEYAADNIIGVLPGTGQLQGCYIICAHYDATATHSFPGETMWWCENPAPGADDNASGVAVVLEAARLLSDLSFPFDLRFIFFSGEELGLLGSEVYADSVAGYRSYADSLVAPPDTIYGVINVDMVALKRSEANPDTCHLVTNTGTQWLGSWMVDTAEEMYPSHFEDFDALRIDQALAYSDHASFWTRGYDALIAIEHWNPRERNPYYHTVDDTIASMSASQLAGAAKLVLGSVARLIDPDGAINLAVFGEDLTFDPIDLVTGTPATVSAEVHVFGPGETVDMTLEIWDGEPDEGELLSSFVTERVMGGGEVIRHDFVWDLAESDLGEHTLWVRVVAEGIEELTEEDNTAATAVRVDSPRLFITAHYPYPNPCGSPDELHFRYELSREARATVLTVYDLLGQELGEFTTVWSPVGGDDESVGTVAGWNSITWDRFEGEPGELASGVYIYRLSVYQLESEEPTDEKTGKFAMVR